MRPLLLVGLLACAVPAMAQAPADSASGATPDTLVASERSARLAFPTEGGVFYYRAGSGSGIRRQRPAQIAPDATGATAAPLTEAVLADLLAPEAGAAPRTEAARASGVSQRDLDRLEERLLRAIDRRLAALDRDRNRDPERRTDPRVPPAVVVVPERTQPVAPTGQQPAPEAPRPVPPRVVAPAPSPGVATPEEIERDILDTGLFRTTFVNFEFARAELIPLSERTLDALATVLLRYPALRIQVGGHTDWDGSDATNDRLSQQRTESVVAYLVAQGIARQRLEAVGYGERRPVASNETETGRALNRRVEFVVLNPEAAERERR